LRPFALISFSFGLLLVLCLYSIQHLMIKVLFLGDVVGRPGREFLIEKISGLRSDLSLHAVVVNAENAAGGAGLTESIAKDLLSAGVDAITLGDHVWDQKGFESEIVHLDRVCRPANLPKQNPGRTHLVIPANGFKIGIFTVLGRNYIGMKAEGCPFRLADELLEELKDECDAFLVEAHMEATSEKVALGWHLDGRVAGVIGTHTHVPTADGRILPKGTAYISDVGMSGPYHSVLGRKVEPVIESFLDGMKRRFPVAEEDVRLSGCLIGIDEKRGIAESFQRFELKKTPASA
jgi:metallophosphoesterase (TIGR00282 family)